MHGNGLLITKVKYLYFFVFRPVFDVSVILRIIYFLKML